MKKTILLFMLFALIFLTACSGKYNTFASCVTESGATMYGTDWCSHCKDQKADFGKSFENIHFVDCDESKQKCLDAGVDGYPTWEIGGELYPGKQSLERIASLTECEFVEG